MTDSSQKKDGDTTPQNSSNSSFLNEILQAAEPVVSNPTPVQAAEPVVSNPTPVQAAEPVVSNPTPVQAAEPVVSNPTPVQAAEPVVSNPTPVQAAEPVVSNPTPVQAAEPVVSNPTPVQAAEPVVSNPTPVQAAEPVVSNPTPVQAAEPVVSNPTPVQAAEPVVSNPTPVQAAEPVVSNPTPVQAAEPVVSNPTPVQAAEPVVSNPTPVQAAEPVVSNPTPVQAAEPVVSNPTPVQAAEPVVSNPTPVQAAEPVVSNPTPVQAATNNVSAGKDSSFLNDVIQSVPKGTTETIVTGDISSSNINNVPPTNTNPALIKKRDPITPAVFFKFVGVIFLVSFIFFGSFLTYVVFNPEQTQFFIRFGIDPNEIKQILRTLVDYVFGIITLFLSIIWIIYLFRSFLTPKEFQKKKTIAIILAVFFGILLFGNITVWASLVQQIKVIDVENPFGEIIIYDNDLYTSEKGKDAARLNSTSELIGPINLYFDISTNAKKTEEREAMIIDDFEIDFDRAKCNNGRSVISGNNPITNKTITCVFDEIKKYTITGRYKGRHKVTQEEKTITMNIPIVDIKGLVEIKKGKNVMGNEVVTINASKLQAIGKPKWIEQGSNSEIIEEPTVTREAVGQERLICLRIIQENGCDRIFIINSIDKKEQSGEIKAKQNIVNPLVYEFNIESDINVNQIATYRWLLSTSAGGGASNTIICDNIQNGTCEYPFNSYGKYKITVEITLTNDEKIQFDKEINIQPPVQLSRALKIIDQEGKELSNEKNYDQTLKAFVLKDIPVPNELKLDARDVIPSSPGLMLQEVEWEVTEGALEPKKQIGMSTVAYILSDARHEITITYVFKNKETGTIEKTKERVIVDSKKTELIPELEVIKTSDYTPTIVRVDASASTTKEGSIKKFIFNFGEGKPAIEGDAIQEYQYLTPGEKTITLTIIRDDGEKASIQKMIVLKEQRKDIVINTSVKDGVTGKPIDFDANGTDGQIADYIWNFGDNTATIHDPAPMHTYENPGDYVVELTINYADGTIKTTSKNITIEANQDE